MAQHHIDALGTIDPYTILRANVNLRWALEYDPFFQDRNNYTVEEWMSDNYEGYGTLMGEDGMGQVRQWLYSSKTTSAIKKVLIEFRAHHADTLEKLRIEYKNEIDALTFMKDHRRFQIKMLIAALNVVEPDAPE